MHVLWAGNIHKASTAKYAYTNNYVLNRKSTSKNLIVRCAAGVMSVVMAIAVVSVFDTGVAPTHSHAAPGSPGVPKSGTILFQEDFENTGSRIPLEKYVGSAVYGNQTYSTDGPWTTAQGGCNGWLLNAKSTQPTSAEDPGCADRGAWGSLRGLAEGLAVAQGKAGEDVSNNYALSEYTNRENRQSAGILIKPENNVAVASAKHFYSVSVYFAAASCTAYPIPKYSPQLAFYLIIDGSPMKDPDGRVMNQINFVTGKADPGTSELTITPDSQGRCSVQITSKLVTRANVHASIASGDKQAELRGNNDPRKASPQPVEFTADTVCVVDCTPVDFTHVTRVEVVADGAEANGEALDVALAYAYDRFGNPVKDAIVTSTGQNMTIGTVNPTAKDGTTLIEYRSTKAGAHPAQVRIAGKTPATAASMDGTTATDGSITLNFASGTADAAHSTLSIEPRASQVVGSTFTVTAHVHDVNDNAVEGAVVTFPEVSGMSFVNGTSCISDPDGICHVMVSSKLVGTYTISGRIGAQPLANTVDAEFTVGPVCVRDCDPVDGANVTRVEVTLDGREADGVQRDVATAYGFDYYGNPVTGAVVQSVPAAGETSLTVQSDVARLDKDGRTTIWYTSTMKGPHKADVWITELTPQGSPVTMSFGNGSGSTATSSWVIASQGPLTVGEDAINTYTATATVKDANYNAVPDALVSFGINDEKVCLILDSASEMECRPAGLDGTVSFSFPAPTGTGAHTVTLTGELSGSVWTTFDTIIEVKTDGTVLHPPTSVASLVLSAARFILGLC